MLQIILKDELAARAIEQAQQKGYDTPEDYIADLLNSDASIAFEDELGLGFKDAFKDALRGKWLTEEEFWQRMAEDDDTTTN